MLLVKNTGCISLISFWLCENSMIIFFLLFLLCVFVLCVLFKKTVKDKKVRKVIIVSVIVLFVLGLLVLKIVNGFVPTPLRIRHLSHLAFPPKNLYNPIIIDDFPFHEAGYTKTYPLKPKYLDIYSIGYFTEKQNISSKDKFKGKIKAEFFYKGKFLFEKTTTSQIAAGYADGDRKMEYFKDVFLMDFEIPLQKKYKKGISVRLTVLEPYEGLKKYGNSVKLFIGVSSIP